MSTHHLDDAERRLLAAWRSLRQGQGPGSRHGPSVAEQHLLSTWRWWNEHPSTRPLWAGTLRDQLRVSQPRPPTPSGLFGPSGYLAGSSSRLLGVVVGGAVGEAVARGRPTAGDRTTAVLFGIEGLIRAHTNLRLGGYGDAVSGVLNGLQHWLHAHGVAWSDCVPETPVPRGTRSTPSDSWLSGVDVVRGLGDGDPALITGLARIAAVAETDGPPDSVAHSDSASALPTAALAALWTSDPVQVCALGTDFAALTHGAPDGHEPAGCFAAIVSALLRGEPLDGAVKSAMSIAGLADENGILTEALRLGTQRPAGSRPTRANIEAMSRGRTGLEALAIAVRAAMSCRDDPATAIRAAADHAGDSVSTSVLCGQLLGALHGPAAITATATDQTLLQVIERLGEDAATEFGPEPVDSDTWFARYPTRTPESSRAPEQVTTTPDVSPRPRFVGSVLGAAIGEALGTPVQTETWDEIRAQYGATGLRDYVPAGHPSGRIGSDTQLLLFTVEGMVRADISRRRDGADDPAHHLQHAYQRWLHTQHLSWPRAAGTFLASTPEPDGWLVEQRPLFQTRAPGRTMMRTLIAFAKGQQETGRPDNPISQSQDSAAVTRAVGVSLWSADPRDSFRAGVTAAALTHGHPEAYLSSGALSVLVSGVVHGLALPAAARSALRELARHTGHEEVSRRINTALRLSTAERETPAPEEVERELGTGWSAAEALGIGLCAALTAEGNFDLGIRTAVNHSGNSATCAAICGSLLGGLVGPGHHWVDDLELSDMIERLAREAVEQFGPHPPAEASWFDRYPPT